MPSTLAESAPGESASRSRYSCRSERSPRHAGCGCSSDPDAAFGSGRGTRSGALASAAAVAHLPNKQIATAWANAERFAARARRHAFLSTAGLCVDAVPIAVANIGLTRRCFTLTRQIRDPWSRMRKRDESLREPEPDGAGLQGWSGSYHSPSASTDPMHLVKGRNDEVCQACHERVRGHSFQRLRPFAAPLRVTHGETPPPFKGLHPE